MKGQVRVVMAVVAVVATLLVSLGSGAVGAAAAEAVSAVEPPPMAFPAAAPGLALAPLAAAPAPSVLTGHVAYYSDHYNWAAIAANHSIMVIPAGFTPIAHLDCGALGPRDPDGVRRHPARGLLWIAGQEPPLPVVVVDCTAQKDMALVQSRNIIAEVPYTVSVAYGFTSDGLVTGDLLLYPPAITSTVPAPAGVDPHHQYGTGVAVATGGGGASGDGATVPAGRSRQGRRGPPGRCCPLPI